MKKLNCILDLNSEVEISKVPLEFHDETINGINELGHSVFKNTLLARAYLRLANMIQNGRANLNAVIERPIIKCYTDKNADKVLIMLSCDVVEEISEDKNNNHGDDKIN